jgi:hypothetical protein
MFHHSQTKRIPFTQDEDTNLRKLVQLFGVNHWNAISSFMNNRSPRQCKERYQNYLSPEIQNLPWTPEEVSKLMFLVTIYGSKWKYLTSHFPGRSENNLKNNWNSFSISKKSWNQKRKTKSKYPKIISTFSTDIDLLANLCFQEKENGRSKQIVE